MRCFFKIYETGGGNYFTIIIDAFPVDLLHYRLQNEKICDILIVRKPVPKRSKGNKNEN